MPFTTGKALTRVTSGSVTAADVVNVAAGNIAAVTVQAALNELDAEKALLAGSVSQAFFATTAASGTNSTRVATTAFVTAINNNDSYRTILQASGSHTAAMAAGTYAMPMGAALAVSGTGTLYPLAVIAIASADHPTVDGITPKLRIRGQIFVNDAAPTGNFTFGLYPITRPATSGGAGLNIYTLGTVVTGSNGATVAAPAADTASNLVGADFALPGDGLYVIGVVTTATVAASSHLHLNAQLQMRNA